MELELVAAQTQVLSYVMLSNNPCAHLLGSTVDQLGGFCH